jgi:hypothetical protein
VSDLKAGARVGHWQLLEELGEGGNAEVWRAERAGDGHVAALKILKTRKIDSRSWARFREEVQFVDSLPTNPGVLPIEEFSLPEVLAKGERAWYAMPVAITPPNALVTATLREVVGAIAQVAIILAELVTDPGVAHRDLKPDNLYLWQGRPAVGDFGLLWRPDREALTTAQVAGAFSYTAPELFREDLVDGELDYGLADVFSLAKTMWAIARGQTFAIPGPHLASDGELRIGQFRTDQNAGTLDRLIERATLATPRERPTMAGLHDELEAWLALPEPGGEALPDLSAIAELVNIQSQPALARERERERLLELGHSAVKRMVGRLTPLFAWMDSELARARTDYRDPEIESFARAYIGMGAFQELSRHTICAGVDDGEEPIAFRLAFGVVIQIFDDGTLAVGGAMLLGHTGALASANDTLPPRRVEAGSVAEEEAIAAATAWINSNVERWLADYAEGAGSRPS